MIIEDWRRVLMGPPPVFTLTKRKVLNMKDNEMSMLDAPESNPCMVDFGSVFADGSAVCDYTNCIDEIGNFMSVVGGLMGRYLEAKELRECESCLRRQYLQRHPFTMGGVDRDTHIYETPWQLGNGTRICIRVTLLLRNSIKVQNANKKMAKFELCEPSGEPIGTMRSLPWYIDNHKEIAHAVRAVMRYRFPNELLASTLARSWIKAGAKEDLPCTIYLGETSEGEDLSIRFRSVDAKSQDESIHTKASLVVNGKEVSLQSLQPPLFKRITPECFNGDSFDEFSDMLGRDEFPYNDWLSVMKGRYDYLWSFQNRHHGQEGIVPAFLQGGIPAEVFHSGLLTADGEAVYGLCRDRGGDGRWTNINWLYADHLRSVGVVRLPTVPNWSLELSPFDSKMPMLKLSRHVLDHASRWAPKESLTDEKDELGHDVFVSDEAEEEAYGYACKELSTSVTYAATHPEEVAYGYYNPVVDRAKGRCSPIAIFLPGFFVEEDGKKTPRAVFAFRLRNDVLHPCYEIPTILPVSYVRRSIGVLGLESPSWVSGECVQQDSISKEAHLAA